MRFRAVDAPGHCVNAMGAIPALETTPIDAADGVLDAVGGRRFECGAVGNGARG